MAKTIIDVRSVTSGAGWEFSESGEAVAVFLLVAYVDSDYPNLGPNQCVVALNAMDYGDDLIGLEIDKLMNAAIEKG